MRKRFKVILNVEIDNPDSPYPAGGSYTHKTRLEGVLMQIQSGVWSEEFVMVTLDKVIDKGEIITQE